METIATSIMSSVGWRVVIVWTQMPGDHSQRTNGVASVPRAEPEDLVADRGDDGDQQRSEKRAG